MRVGYTYARRYAARLMLRTMLTGVVISEADPATAERHPERVVAHEVDQVLAVAAAAGAHTLVRDLVLPVTDADRAAVAGLPERPVVVQLGQRWTEHGSTTASCLQLFRELRALGRPVIATYGEDARALGEAVAQAGVADAVLGGLAFHVWAAVFERAACVVTIDTGATHVASAVQRSDGRPVRAQVVSAGLAGMVAVPRAERDPPQTAGRIRRLAARLARRDRRRRRFTDGPSIG